MRDTQIGIRSSASSSPGFASALLALAVVAVCPLIYTKLVVQQGQYFTANFRVLSTLAQQLDGIVDAEARALAIFAGGLKTALLRPPDKYSETLTKNWVDLRDHR